MGCGASSVQTTDEVSHSVGTSGTDTDDGKHSGRQVGTVSQLGKLSYHGREGSSERFFREREALREAKAQSHTYVYNYFIRFLMSQSVICGTLCFERLMLSCSVLIVLFFLLLFPNSIFRLERADPTFAPFSRFQDLDVLTAETSHVLVHAIVEAHRHHEETKGASLRSPKHKVTPEEEAANDFAVAFSGMLLWSW